MLSRQQGFSLLETVIVMAISSTLLLMSARFLPALQQVVIQQTRQQAVEDELWQRLYTIAKHLQRAGYCNGNCSGKPLVIDRTGNCVIVQWDENSNGRWEPSGHSESEQTGFRLRHYALETLRGATSCAGQGWEKITDPQQLSVQHFSIIQHRDTEYSPQFTITLAASVPGNVGQ